MKRKALKKTLAYMGIDPGLGGAISLVSEERDLIDVFDFPVIAKSSGKGNQIDAFGLYNLMRMIKGLYKIEMGVLEQVSAMPNQGVSSMFSFGRTLGTIEMAIACFNFPTISVTPATWKKEFSLINKNKEAARTLVCKMFPEQTNFFSRKKDVDRADASLMALYSWKYKKGKV